MRPLHLAVGFAVALATAAPASGAATGALALGDSAVVTAGATLAAGGSVLSDFPRHASRTSKTNPPDKATRSLSIIAMVAVSAHLPAGTFSKDGLHYVRGTARADCWSAGPRRRSLQETARGPRATPAHS